MNRKYRNVLLFTTLCIFAFGLAYFLNDRNKKKLIEQKVETTGFVDRVEHFPRGSGLRIWYRYNVNKSSYIKSYHLFVDSRHRKDIELLIQGKHLPIIYDKAEKENSSLLLTQDDFARYKVQLPDSLRELTNLIAKLKT